MEYNHHKNNMNPIQFGFEITNILMNFDAEIFLTYKENRTGSIGLISSFCKRRKKDHARKR